MPVSRPRRRFAYFAAAGKVGRPQAESPNPRPARRRNILFYVKVCNTTRREAEATHGIPVT